MKSFVAEQAPWICVVLVSMGLGLLAAMTYAAGPNANPTVQAQNHATQASPSSPASQPVELALPAMIIPDEQVELYAKASGYISKITVDYGSKVHRGDVLIELDIPELRDELKQAEATLQARRAKAQSLQAKARQAELLIQSARAEQERYAAEQDLAKITFVRKSELYQGKAIPAQEFDVAKNAVALTSAQMAVGRARVAAAGGDFASAQAEVKAVEAETAMAEADVARVNTLLGYTRITAPFDGVITQRNVDHGAFVRSAAQAAGAPLLTLVKMDRVRLLIDVPEMSAPRVRVGTPATIQLRSIGETDLHAAVTRTALAIQPGTRTMKAQIDLDNHDGRLMPGMYARVLLATGPG